MRRMKRRRDESTEPRTKTKRKNAKDTSITKFKQRRTWTRKWFGRQLEENNGTKTPLNTKIRQENNKTKRKQLRTQHESTKFKKKGGKGRRL